MNSIAPTVSPPYLERWAFWPWIIGGALFVAVCQCFALDWYWSALGFVVFLVIATRFSNQAIIDYDRRKVIEHTRLFGRRVVRTREHSFSDFRAIVYQTRRNESEDETAVGLQLNSGRRIWFRSFDNGGFKRGRWAEEFAWRLHSDTGIEIDERNC